MSIIALYCTFGCIAGILAGLLGIGGGIVIVPMLVFAFTCQNIQPEAVMLLALGTSHGSILFTSLSSAHSHSRRGAVDWRTVRSISPGILLGTFAGTHVAVLMPRMWLQLIFVCFLTYVAVQMLAGRKPRASRQLPDLCGMSFVGVFIGMVSSLVGIGGGTLSVPFLVWHNMEMRRAIGTSAAIGFPIALAGSAGYVLSGWNSDILPAWSLGYLYLPGLVLLVLCSTLTAPLGARMAHTLPVPQLKRCFAVLLLAVAFKMFIDIL